MPTLSKNVPISGRRVFVAVGDEIHHPDYTLQSDTWDMMSDLYEGYSAIADSSNEYLYMTELEAKESRTKSADERSRYQQRLERSPYINGISRLTRFAMANLFRESPIVPESLPPRMGNFLDDVDLMNKSMPDFIREIANFSYVFGHYFILVDMPVLPEDASLQDERDFNIRPYFVAIDPRDVINWRIEQRVDGKHEFLWAVIRHTEFVSAGPFDEAEFMVTYKVWYKDRWELWGTDKTTSSHSGGRIKLDEGVNTLGEVPLVPVFSNQIRPMVSNPPLIEAAYLNLAHFNFYSMMVNGMMFHLNPLLTITGAKPESASRSADFALFIPQNADAKYVEFTGAAMSVGHKISEELAREVMEAGLRNTSFLGANTSAEARRLSRSDFDSYLQSIAAGYEFALVEAMRLAGRWVGIELTNDQTRIRLNRDFDVVVMEAAMAEFLLKSRMQGEISRNRFYEELIRGEILSNEIDIEEEIRQAKEDGPAPLVKSQIDKNKLKPNGGGSSGTNPVDGGPTNNVGGGGEVLQ